MAVLLFGAMSETYSWLLGLAIISPMANTKMAATTTQPIPP